VRARSRPRFADGSEFTALSERMLHLLILRVAMAAIVFLWASVRPELVGVTLAQLGAASLAFAARPVAAGSLS
jgi:hypothetical protein